MWSCTWSNKRVKSCYCARARLSTDQDNLWREQPVLILLHCRTEYGERITWIACTGRAWFHAIHVNMQST